MPLNLNPKLSFSRPTPAFTDLTTNKSSLLSIDLDYQLSLCEKDRAPVLNPLNLGVSSLEANRFGANQMSGANPA